MRHPLLAVALLLAGCAPAALAPAPAAGDVVGALVDRSAAAGGVGANVEAGLALAEADVNAWAAAKGATFRLSLAIEDAQGDPLAAFARLKARGVKTAVGPVTSAAAAVLMAPATADGIVLISPSSTAPALAVDDNLLRFAPVDVLQGVALTRAMAERGVKAVSTIARDDVYGRGLAQEVEYAAGLQGITHVGTVTYSPDATSYAEAVAKAEALVAGAQTRFGADAVAVELVSYDEAVGVMAAAEGAAALGRARWFGCDGNSRSAVLFANPQAAAFARKVGFLASAFVTPSEAGLETAPNAILARPADLAARAAARLGRPADTFVYTAYDAYWALALAREELGGLADPARVKASLYARSQSFVGVAGPATLNPQGDRTTGTYGFFSLGADAWKLDALYGNTTYTRLD